MSRISGLEKNYPSFHACVDCVTYNHAGYIVDAMDGFCAQKTSFPFVCVIVDDASTDGTLEIIIKYLQENFELNGDSLPHQESTEDYILYFLRHKNNRNCYFAVYQLKYNYYSLGKSKSGLYSGWNNRADYVALCEGDDYWTDASKLQKQCSFLDAHPDYTLVCNRTYLFSQRDGRIVGETYCYPKSRDISVKDMIYRTGLFVSTCSIVYRKEVSEDMPGYWRQCVVGDYPLQIACAMKGKCWYMNEAMSVYRINNVSSWMGKQNWAEGGSDPKRLNVIKSQINMFRGFASDYPQYKRLFQNKIAEHINRNIPKRDSDVNVAKQHLACFADEIGNYSLRWKLDLFFRKCRIPRIRGLYTRLFLRGFRHRRLYYS